MSDTSSTDSDITDPKKSRDSPDSEVEPGSLAYNDAGESDCAVRLQDKCISSENTGTKWKRVKNVEAKPYVRKKGRIKAQTNSQKFQITWGISKRKVRDDVTSGERERCQILKISDRTSRIK